MADSQDTLAMRHSLQSRLDDPSALLAEMKRLALEISDVMNAPVYSIAAELNIVGSPFIRAVSASLRQGLSKSDIYTFMFPAISLCQNADTETLIDFLDAAVTSTENLPGNIVHILIPLLEASPLLGYECVDAALKIHNENLAIPLAFATATSAARGIETMSYFVNRAQSENSDEFAVGLRGLHAIAVDKLALAPEYISSLSSIVNRAISKKETMQDGYGLLAHLSFSNASSAELLLTRVQTGIPEAALETAYWLLNFGRKLSPDRLEDFLIALITVAMQDDLVRQNTDSAIAHLMYLSTASAPMDAVLLALGRKFSDGRLDEKFPAIYGAITSNDARYSRVISLWLLEPHISIPALRTILSLGPVNSNRVRGDIVLFAVASQELRVKAVRRMIGLCYNGAAIAGLLLQLAVDPTNKAWAVPAFIDVVSNFLCVEYPGETKDFLQEAIKTTVKKGKLQRVISTILKEMAIRDQLIESLPHLKELAPTQEKKITLRLAQSRRDSEIQSGAREKSFFSKIATPIHLKQGRRFITSMPGGGNSVTQMSTYSVGFELPRSEHADPLLGMLQRLDYLEDIN